MESDTPIEETLHAATTAHRAGRLDEAEALYTKVLQSQPNHAEAMRLRGVIARERGDLGASGRMLARAVELAPDDALCLDELALTYMAAGQLAEAADALQEALTLKPLSVRTLINLGAVMHQRGHLNSAIDCYRRAIEQEPGDAFVYCNLARALSDAGDGDAALECCDTAIQKAAGDTPNILATRGAVLLERELYAEARAVLEEAAAAGLRDDMLLINTALACCQLGDPAAAETALCNARELNPYNARAVADLANILFARGNAADAIEVCETFLRRYPGERLVIGALALALHNAGRTDEATELTDCSRLVQTFDIDCPEEFDSLDEFNKALTENIRSDESLLSDPVSKSTFGGDQTGELDFRSDASLAAFTNVLARHIPQVIDHYVDAGLAEHPVMAPAGQPQSLRAWGTVLRSGGRQTSHMHPLGWLSGVYYTQLPDSMTNGDGYAGWLEFNRPPERFHAEPPTAVETIEPREGRLVIFPSWFWHQTIPFVGEGTRVSIAFDIVPTASLRLF